MNETSCPLVLLHLAYCRLMLLLIPSVLLLRRLRLSATIDGVPATMTLFAMMSAALATISAAVASAAATSSSRQLRRVYCRVHTSLRFYSQSALDGMAGLLPRTIHPCAFTVMHGIVGILVGNRKE